MSLPLSGSSPTPLQGQGALAKDDTDALRLLRCAADGTLRVDPTGSTPQPISDGGGSLTVDDGGGSLTVDGTVALSGTVDVSDRSARALGRAFLRNPGDTANMGDGTTPVRVDPTGTTTQPVSDAGSSLTVDDGGASLTVDGTVAVSGTTATTYPDATSGPSVLNGAAQTLVLNLSGHASATFLFASSSGTWTAVFELSSDGGTTWMTVQALTFIFTLPSIVASATSNGQFLIPCAGYNAARVRISAYTSGSTTVSGRGTLAGLANVLTASIPPGGYFIGGVSTQSRASSPATPTTANASITGLYGVAGSASLVAASAINSPVFSFRCSSATVNALVTRVYVSLVETTALTAAQLFGIRMMLARSFSASDTGGTALTPSGNNGKKRTSYSASVIGSVRIGGPLTAGTRTLDANPIRQIEVWAPAAVGSLLTDVVLYDFDDTSEGPLVFAQNEGFVIDTTAAMPAAGAVQVIVGVEWFEVNSASSGW